MIYLDHNATTPLAAEAREAMIECLQASFGNPSSQHAAGKEAKRRVAQARADVAALFGARPAEVVFTSGATESNHAAVFGAAGARAGRDEIVVSAVEHPSLLAAVAAAEARGNPVHRIGVDAEGRLDLAALERHVGPRTALVSVMWANNETGVVMPVPEAARIAKAQGALFHSDATQAAGRLPIDWNAVPVDLLSCSAHKLYGPKGIGALLVRKTLDLPPLFAGSQERGRRGGTENVPAIVGFAAAAGLATRRLGSEPAGIAGLRDRLEAAIRARFPFARVLASKAARVPNTSCISFAPAHADAVLAKLDRAGICASSGSACAAGGSRTSHVLAAMGLPQDEAQGAVRFSLGSGTTEADVEAVLAALEILFRPQGKREARAPDCVESPSRILKGAYP